MMHTVTHPELQKRQLWSSQQLGHLLLYLANKLFAFIGWLFLFKRQIQLFDLLDNGFANLQEQQSKPESYCVTPPCIHIAWHQVVIYTNVSLSTHLCSMQGCTCAGAVQRYSYYLHVIRACVLGAIVCTQVQPDCTGSTLPKLHAGRVILTYAYQGLYLAKLCSCHLQGAK